MSGTSLDGVDAALIKTDGESVFEIGTALTKPYSQTQKRVLRSIIKMALREGAGAMNTSAAAEAEHEVTSANAEIVNALLEQWGGDRSDVDVIGFHGQTILHRPMDNWTWQMGDGKLLASELGIPVINDFRSADVASGGEGAPLAPLYHQALVRGAGLNKADWPVAVLNIGGVANATWLSEEGELLAFDTGPGNGMIDDWMREQTGRDFDAEGEAAARGNVDGERLKTLLSASYFERPAPKSLDKLHFPQGIVDGLSVEDGAATLSAFTVASINRAVELMPSSPRLWLVCGGGRKNMYLMGQLSEQLKAKIWSVDQMGWRGDSLEAEAFAFLAVRSLSGLPLSLPSTTGVPAPMTGGVRYDP